MRKKKIFNDPVYGFISFPYDIIYDLIDHPFMQRLRRINQLGLTYLVYPGAVHTRFHHAMGAAHLMTQAILVLKSKGVEITDEEAEALIIGILLHDIGHGPFSHALEGRLLNVSHEAISLAFMHELNEVYDGALDLAILIFSGKYHKQFLHRLISSQLDMDRLDYLNRDSYYTGVVEGVIGYDRIIKMLDVVDDELVVEEKGIYSIERFLASRQMMYWQVYLHKTALCAEQMLVKLVDLVKSKIKEGRAYSFTEPLNYFLSEEVNGFVLQNDRKHVLKMFNQLDNVDILHLIKVLAGDENKMIAFLANSLLNRNLFSVRMQDEPFDERIRAEIETKLMNTYPFFKRQDVQDLILSVSEKNTLYKKGGDEIKILKKTGEVQTITAYLNKNSKDYVNVKYFLCFPKIYS